MTEIIDKQFAQINSEECRNTSGLNDKGLPCAVVRDLLPLYHDRVVSEETADLIEAHLEGCEDCRAELNSIRSDEQIEANLMEKENSSFKDLRDGVGMIRRKGTVRGLLIALAALACCLGLLIFLNNEDVVKVDPSDLKIGDVYRYDLGDNGGQGLFFTGDISWSGGWSTTFDDSNGPAEINILIKRTVLGGKMESDSRNPRIYWIVDDFYDTDTVDISKADVVKVNGQTIWTREQGVDDDPPEYIAELVKYEHGYDDMKPANKAIDSKIDNNSVSITYEDLHGIKWDKDGNVIATYTVDEDGNIQTMDGADAGDSLIVPDLIGMTQEEAVEAVKDSGFALGNIEYAVSGKGKGVVSRQIPAPSSKAGKGAVINITIEDRKQDD